MFGQKSAPSQIGTGCHIGLSKVTYVVLVGPRSKIDRFLLHSSAIREFLDMNASFYKAEMDSRIGVGLGSPVRL